MKLVKRPEMKNLIGRIRLFPPKLENDENLSEKNLTNENDAQNSPNRGDDIIVLEISENDARNEILSPRAGKYNLRPNPNPIYSEDFRY